MTFRAIWAFYDDGTADLPSSTVLVTWQPLPHCLVLAFPVTDLLDVSIKVSTNW